MKTKVGMQIVEQQHVGLTLAQLIALVDEQHRQRDAAEEIEELRNKARDVLLLLENHPKGLTIKDIHEALPAFDHRCLKSIWRVGLLLRNGQPYSEREKRYYSTYRPRFSLP